MFASLRKGRDIRANEKQYLTMHKRRSTRNNSYMQLLLENSVLKYYQQDLKST